MPLSLVGFAAGDWGTIEKSLEAAGLPLTKEGAREYLRQWAKRMGQPLLGLSNIAGKKEGSGCVCVIHSWKHFGESNCVNCVAESSAEVP